MVFEAYSYPRKNKDKAYIAIFCHLTIPQLSIVSRVCKRWSTHALSLLYHRISITSSTIWSHFIEYKLFQKYSSTCKELILFSINLSSSDKSLLLECTNDLNHIALLKCHNLDEDFLFELTLKHSTTLGRFTLWGPRTFESGVTTITDNLLKRCLPNLLNVRHLSMCAANITDQFLLLFVSTLSDPNNVNAKPPSLIGLNLTECWKITAFGVAEIFSPNHLPSLRQLRLQYHKENDIDVEYFDTLATSFPDHHFEFLLTKHYLRNKVLLNFDQISRELDSLVNKNLNVSVERRENVWTDDEIRESKVTINH